MIHGQTDDNQSSVRDKSQACRLGVVLVSQSSNQTHPQKPQPRCLGREVLPRQQRPACYGASMIDTADLPVHPNPNNAAAIHRWA